MFAEKSFNSVNRKVYSTTLGNGLKVVIVPMPGFHTSFASLTVNYGGMDNAYFEQHTKSEISIPPGVAHFLEHQLFIRPDGADASKFFAGEGALCNAMTFWCYTTYLFHTANHGRFYDCLEFLMDFVRRPAFTEQSIARETDIIRQEIAGWLDSPWWVSKLGLLDALYRNHPGRVPVMGTPESIQEIGIEELIKCHKAFYYPENMVLFACGDIDPETIVGLARSNSVEDYDVIAKGERLTVYEPPSVNKAVVSHRLDMSCPTVTVGLKCKPYGPSLPPPEQRLKRRVCAEVLLEALFGESSVLRWDMYSNGLINGNINMDFWDFGDVNHLYISSRTHRPKEFGESIKESLIRSVNSGISSDRIELARRTVLGRYLSTCDKPVRFGWRYSAALPLGMDFLEIIPLLQTLGSQDIQRFASENIKPDTIAVSEVLPHGWQMEGR